MPLYEYYCEACDRVFESLRPLTDSGKPAVCPGCGGEAERIMPTTFAPMSFKQGWPQRVPFHHHPVRADEPKKAIAPVNPKRLKTARRGRVPKGD